MGALSLRPEAWGCMHADSWRGAHDEAELTAACAQCPEGELQKRKEVVHTVTLHEIDVINSRYVQGLGFRV